MKDLDQRGCGAVIVVISVDRAAWHLLHESWKLIQRVGFYSSNVALFGGSRWMVKAEALSAAK